MERLDEFDVLRGFTLLEAHEGMAESNDGDVANVLIMKFVNTKKVAIDVVFIDEEWKIEEPYAVDDDYRPLKSEGTHDDSRPI